MTPTIFEYMRRFLKLPQNDVWFISSNKALTSRIGANSAVGYGPNYGANVLFPKQMLIDAVINAAFHRRAAHTASRTTMAPELASMLGADNFEGLGWSVDGDDATLERRTRGAVMRAVEDLSHGASPVTGDEFTYFVTLEVMRRFTPSLLVMSFSDVEVAHFGSPSSCMCAVSFATTTDAINTSYPTASRTAKSQMRPRIFLLKCDS